MESNVENEITAVRPNIADATAEEVVPGATFGDIQLGQLVAAGVSGEVFQGKNLIAGKPCAFKVLHAASGGAVARGRYSHEAKQVAAFGNSAVADIFGFGHTDGGRLYAILEWVEGRVLRDLVRRHAPLSQRNYLPLIRELCTVLGTLHAAGFAHRRLHGGNVIVQWPEEGHPRVKLLDFGVWRVHPPLDEQSEEPRPADQAIYLAPEQIKGEPGDKRSDIYALGVLLYEMLTGKVPFLADTFAATLEQHLNDPVRPPSELANVPVGIDETVLRALEKDPKRRTPSVEALLGAFDPVSVSTGQHQQVPAQGKIRALTTGEMKLEDLEAAQSGPQSGHVGARTRPPTFEQDPVLMQPVKLAKPKRRLWLFVVLGVTLLVFGGAVAWMLLGGEEPVVKKPVVKKPVRRAPRTSPARRPTVRRRPPPKPHRAAGAQPKTPITLPSAKAGATAAPRPAGVPPVVSAGGRPGSAVVGTRLPIDRLRLRRNDPNAKHGTVTLTSASPTTMFYLDGRFVGGGQRRVLQRVPVGKHRLHATDNGRKSPVREVEIKAGQKIELPF